MLQKKVIGESQNTHFVFKTSLENRVFFRVG